MLDYIQEIRDILKFYDLKFRKTGVSRNSGFMIGLSKGFLDKGIEYDLMNYNYSEILNGYVDYFNSKNLKTIRLSPAEEYYRARIGHKSIEVFFGNQKIDMPLPYYDKYISQVPPLLATGGRFNREGVSNLYLADSIKTALVEVHAQVGQVVSVAKFQLYQPEEFLDLSTIYDDTELEAWKLIFTQPIQRENNTKYLITQFLADVLKNINENGFYFKSSQTDGHNIVSFKSNMFHEAKFSEELYSIGKISYDYNKCFDFLDHYAGSDYERLLGNSKVSETNNKADYDYYIERQKHKFLDNN